MIIGNQKEEDRRGDNGTPLSAGCPDGKACMCRVTAGFLGDELARERRVACIIVCMQYVYRGHVYTHIHTNRIES